jgi:hypothetical protein
MNKRLPIINTVKLLLQLLEKGAVMMSGRLHRMSGTACHMNM